jgi:hypothetical protein
MTTETSGLIAEIQPPKLLHGKPTFQATAFDFGKY